MDPFLIDLKVSGEASSRRFTGASLFDDLLRVCARLLTGLLQNGHWAYFRKEKSCSSIFPS
jgi:hypothetical protein